MQKVQKAVERRSVFSNVQWSLCDKQLLMHPPRMKRTVSLITLGFLILACMAESNRQEFASREYFVNDLAQEKSNKQPDKLETRDDKDVEPTFGDEAVGSHTYPKHYVRIPSATYLYKSRDSQPFGTPIYTGGGTAYSNNIPVPGLSSINNYSGGSVSSNTYTPQPSSSSSYAAPAPSLSNAYASSDYVTYDNPTAYAPGPVYVDDYYYDDGKHKSKKTALSIALPLSLVLGPLALIGLFALFNFKAILTIGVVRSLCTNINFAANYANLCTIINNIGRRSTTIEPAEHPETNWLGLYKFVNTDSITKLMEVLRNTDFKQLDHLEEEN